MHWFVLLTLGITRITNISLKTLGRSLLRFFLKSYQPKKSLGACARKFKCLFIRITEFSSYREYFFINIFTVLVLQLFSYLCLVLSFLCFLLFPVHPIIGCVRCTLHQLIFVNGLSVFTFVSVIFILGSIQSFKKIIHSSTFLF